MNPNLRNSNSIEVRHCNVLLLYNTARKRGERFACGHERHDRYWWVFLLLCFETLEMSFYASCFLSFCFLSFFCTLYTCNDTNLRRVRYSWGSKVSGFAVMMIRRRNTVLRFYAGLQRKGRKGGERRKGLIENESNNQRQTTLTCRTSVMLFKRNIC